MLSFDRGTFERFAASIEADFIQRALSATGTATIRKRRLPAVQVIWLVLGMALFRNQSIRDVARELDIALPTPSGKPAASSALVQARQRLGAEPLRWLFHLCAEVWAVASAQRHAWRGLSLYALDGTTVRVPDSPENRAAFGGHVTDRGNSGYPIARLVTLMALRSHLLLGAAIGRLREDERGLSTDLWSLVPDDSVLIVDRHFLAANALIPFERHGKNRQWLTRNRANRRWKTIKKLGSGDRLVEGEITAKALAQNPALPDTWTVRAIEYRRKGFRPQELLTSMLDPKEFPAEELVELYHERWEIELGYDEVKTEMLEREETIRSLKPDGVHQELWGLLLAYNLIRREMEEIAAEAKVAPTRISFVAALQSIRIELIRFAFAPPGNIPKRLARLRSDLTHFVLPERRARAYPRAVKLTRSPYKRKRTAATDAGRKAAK